MTVRAAMMAAGLVLAGMAAGMGAGTEAVAQEATDNGAGLNIGEQVVDGRTVGEEYLKETFGDWAHRCVVAAEGDDPCNSYQLLFDEDGNSVAEISIVPLSDAGQAVAGGTIVTPLETLLTRQITLQIDAGPGRRYPFTFCARTGCISRVGFTAEDLDALKRGAEATLTIVPAGAPDNPVALSVSLTGFTAAFDALEPR
ncbi:MAG: invasion associated locus B family protein [Pseudomonadota bacterium]